MDRRHFLGTSVAAVALGAQSSQPKVMWTVDLQSPSYGGGAIGDLNGEKTIVFGTYYNDEHLYAVRARDGKVLWKHKSSGGPFDASVALTDLDGDGNLEVLAADSSTGDLFCLDGSGQLLWKYKLPSSTDSPPAVADLDGDGKPEIVVGTMTAGDRIGRVIVLNPRTRREIWSTKIAGHVQSEPVLVDLNGDGKLDVIVTNWLGDKHIYALSGRDGTLLWQHLMKGDIYHGVSAFQHDGVRILANSRAGDVVLLDGTGKVIWTKEINEYLFAPTAVGDLDADGRPELIVCGKRVHVFGIYGKERWQSADFQSIARGVAIADVDGDGKPDLLFGAKDRQFRALNGTTGKELLNFDATVQGHVYEGIDSGPVVFDFDGDGQSEVFFVCGKGTSDETKLKNYGRAFALKLSSGKGGWPMFRGNLHRNGQVAP